MNVAMEWIRSTDGGKSWSRPVLVSERRGPGGKLYLKRPEGGYVALQDRNQAIGQLPSGRIVVSFCRSTTPTAKRVRCMPKRISVWTFYCWSDDLGKTWCEVRAMQPGLVGGKGFASSPQWRIVSLADGTAMMSHYGLYNPHYQGPVKAPKGTRKLATVIRSTDNGETWGDPSIIVAEPGDQCYEETALCLVGRKLFAHVRTPAGNVVQYVSTDDGRTWKGPRPLTEIGQTPDGSTGQQPGGAFLLKSGKLMATWGNRRPPYGAMAMIGGSDGKSWAYPHRVSLAWDAPNVNCGYANGAQAGDGTIVVVYYIMHVETSSGHDQWMGSKVYAVRFTEKQFLEAAGCDPELAAALAHGLFPGE